MTKLTTMTRALQHYGFVCLVDVSDDPFHVDHSIMVAEGISIQVPSMGEAPYSLWHQQGEVFELVTETNDAYMLAKQLYNLAKGV